jgi:hypothetical protein
MGMEYILQTIELVDPVVALLSAQTLAESNCVKRSFVVTRNKKTNKKKRDMMGVGC